MYRSITLSVSAIAISWATSAMADSPNLKGAYGFTGTAACLVAPGHYGDPNGTPLANPTPGAPLANSGFSANLQPNDAQPGSPTEAFTRSFSVEGVRTFNGDGTGTVQGTAVDVTHRPTPGPGGYPHFPPSASSATFAFSFTYTVNDDGSWTSTMVPGSFIEHILTGPRAGQTVTVDAIPPIAGWISQDGQTLTAEHPAPTVEVRTFSNGDVWPEICHRSRVFIALRKGKDKD